MRALVRWSDNSFSVTTPRPCQGEPSRRALRCMSHLLRVLEVARVNVFETRMIERKLLEPPAGGDDFRRRVRPHVALAQKTPAAGLRLADVAHAGKRRQALAEIVAAVRFDLDRVAAAEHLTAELRDRPHEHDLPGIEQRDAVAHALHAVEQMRREKNAHARRLEIAD